LGRVGVRVGGVITTPRSSTTCITFRIPTEKLQKLAQETKTRQVSLNMPVNQIINEHIDLHGLASQAKLYYLPKSFMMRLINEYTKEELCELARQTAKNDLVDIGLFLKGGFSIASLADITETWRRVSRMPYRYDTRGDSCKIIIQHEMGMKYSYLIREICRYLLEVAFERKAFYNMTDDTLVIEGDFLRKEGVKFQ
jgi:hypothetical protein